VNWTFTLSHTELVSWERFEPAPQWRCPLQTPFFFVCEGFLHEKELHNRFHHQNLEVSGQIGERLEKKQLMDVQDLKQTVD